MKGRPGAGRARGRPAGALPRALAGLGALALLYAPALAAAQTPGGVLDEEKVSDAAGSGASFADGDAFGGAVAVLPDLDGDGRGELAVGARGRDTGGPDQGAVWLLRTAGGAAFDGPAAELAEGSGGFTGDLSQGDHFGTAVAALDLAQGPALAVGATGDDQGGPSAGAVWIVPVAEAGAAGPALRVAAGHPAFGGEVGAVDALGSSLAALGDLDGDGTIELAAGAPGDDHGGTNRGAVWILDLAPSGVPLSALRIAQGSGGFGFGLDDHDQFGAAVAALGDLDGDGLPELAVGAPFDDDGGPNRGALWILFLRPDGTVREHRKISSTAGGFGGALALDDRFGDAIARTGLLHPTAAAAAAVGAPGDDDGGSSQGAAWILFLDEDGSVLSQAKISAASGGFAGDLSLGDFFASSLADVGDLDGDERADLACGAPFDDDGGNDRGALWLLHLDGHVPAKVLPYGCGFHPPGSFAWLGGEPTLGSSVTVGVDNPLGTQAPGSIPLALVSLAPDPLFPCGTPVPGWGMPGFGIAGQLLVDPAQLVLPIYAGDPWTGPGQPASIELPVPNAIGLLGETAYVQGVMYDPVGAGGVTVGLADAVELRFGP